MEWQRLNSEHIQQYQNNRRMLAAERPELNFKLNNLDLYQEHIETCGTGEILQGIRIREGNEYKFLLTPEHGARMLEQQRYAIDQALNKGARLLVLSGIGAGHAVTYLHERLLNHPYTAAIVCEPNPAHWAALMTLFPCQEILPNKRLFLFGGDTGAQDAVTFIHQEYVFLLPHAQISYLLGILPNDPAEAQGYADQARNIAGLLQQRSREFSPVMERFNESLALPLSRTPKTAWCSVHRDAYIHFPIAQAFMRGLQQIGVEAHLDPFDDGWSTVYRLVGHFMEQPPDLVVTMNAWPSLLLEDIGLTRETVMRLQRPRVCWLMDNTFLYEESTCPDAFHPLDWIICNDRAFLPSVQTLTKQAVFMPIATTLEGPGQFRPELAAPISYVGSLPNLMPYMINLHPAVVEMLQRMDRLKGNDYSLSFSQHLHSLQPPKQHFQRLLEAARAFSATTGKEMRSDAPILEYFLYNAATFFKRKTLVEAMLPLGLRVYGPNSWLDILPEKYRSRFGGFVANNDLSDVYASSTLNLNIHSHQCPTCLNVRDFDVPMAGGVSLGDWVEDMDRGLLQPGQELLAFHSIEEAVQITSEWIGRKDELERIRKQGQERVMREHTFQERARRILEDLL